ncbi:phospholipase A2 inhibitor and Ly6/PLAUR domain-containing protein-like [Protopterus annectens]|uniref:phospholipase A2 inhibitor and Ly6/PLAUR domain-containing protein-like n=1 Tax=Protopterus annectens TaxID=7888 RepID=UPI001CFAD627|nr:phospholipase A2 inhibitor and Ly6/PLAUR domain-containing protein-like [Protopterus annectens]
MKISLVVYIFSVFLMKVSIQLQCFRCTALGSTTCTQTAQNCSAERSNCLTSSVRLEYGMAVQNNSLLKTCSALDFCNKQITGNFGNAKMTILTDCCTSNLCNLSAFNISGLNTTTNGRFCNACSGTSADACVNKYNQTQCTGNQDQCITASGTFFSGISYVSGCASSDLCSKTIQQNLAFILMNITDSKCTAANGSMGTTLTSISRSRIIVLASMAVFALKLF